MSAWSVVVKIADEWRRERDSLLVGDQLAPGVLTRQQLAEQLVKQLTHKAGRIRQVAEFSGPPPPWEAMAELFGQLAHGDPAKPPEAH